MMMQAYLYITTADMEWFKKPAVKLRAELCSPFAGLKCKDVNNNTLFQQLQIVLGWVGPDVCSKYLDANQIEWYLHIAN